MADVIHFDTLETSLILPESGLESDKATAIVAAIKNSQVNLATKADIASLNASISNLESGFNWIRWAITTLGTLCAITVAAVFWIIAQLQGLV